MELTNTDLEIIAIGLLILASFLLYKLYKKR